jgi:nascent polypeptide-associated complex subunit alpha
MINQKQMKRMMERMGMDQNEIEAKSVIIVTKYGKNIVFNEPNVVQMNMMGQEMFQIVGEYQIKHREVEIEKDEEDDEEIEEEIQETSESKISQEDIDLVSEKTNKSKEDAKKALEKSNGDIAQAIISLS